MDREVDVVIARLGPLLWGYEFRCNGHETRGTTATRRGAMSAARRKAWFLWGAVPVFTDAEN